MIPRMKISVIGLIACSLFAGLGNAHPAHQSVAEAEFNAETGRWEVALRVHVVDLERALRGATEQPIDLEPSADGERAILEYLSERFVLRRPDRTATPIAWVGKEIEGDDCWLYFELSCPDPLADAELRNSIFFEIFPDQMNLMTIRVGQQRRTICFHRDQPERPLLPRDPQLQSPIRPSMPTSAAPNASN